MIFVRCDSCKHVCVSCGSCLVCAECKKKICDTCFTKMNCPHDCPYCEIDRLFTRQNLDK